MTYKLLAKIIEHNNIPHDVRLLSNVGWEYGEIDMRGVYYNTIENHIVFTQTNTIDGKTTGDMYYEESELYTTLYLEEDE